MLSAHYILWCNWRKAIIPPSLVLALTTFKLQHAPGCTLGLVLIINNIPCACVITNTCFCILHSNCPLHNSNWCCHSSTPHYVVMSSLPPCSVTMLLCAVFGLVSIIPLRTIASCLPVLAFCSNKHFFKSKYRQLHSLAAEIKTRGISAVWKRG